MPWNVRSGESSASSSDEAAQLELVLGIEHAIDVLLLGVQQGEVDGYQRPHLRPHDAQFVDVQFARVVAIPKKLLDCFHVLAAISGELFGATFFSALIVSSFRRAPLTCVLSPCPRRSGNEDGVAQPLQVGGPGPCNRRGFASTCARARRE